MNAKSCFINLKIGINQLSLQVKNTCRHKINNMNLGAEHADTISLSCELLSGIAQADESDMDVCKLCIQHTAMSYNANR